MKKKRVAHVAAAALAAALLWVYSAGCDRCSFEDECLPRCEVNADCDDGFVCVEVAFSSVSKRCTKPCSSSAECAACSNCNCRCVDDPGKGVCDAYTLRTDNGGGDPGQLCRADLDRQAACHWLCVACSCSHLDCPGGLKADQCEAECAGAYGTFPGCAQQLDAYYFCGHRGATCPPGPQGYPFFEADTTCPSELTALQSCVTSTCPSASCGFKLFYPVTQ